MTDMPARAGKVRDSLIAGGILFVVLILLLWGPVAEGVSSASKSGQARDLVHALAREAQSGDSLPENVPLELHGNDGLESSTVRLLAVDDESSYWVGLDRQANVCLLIIDVKDSYSSAATCDDPGVLKDNGLALTSTGPAWHAEAFLVADGYAAAKLPPGWVQISDNIITVAVDADRNATISGERGALELGRLQPAR
jgi:hypothetical protein